MVLELLDYHQILQALTPTGKKRLTCLEIFSQISSTNTYLKNAAAAGAKSGVACLAEQQTAGRGRAGRTWISPFGVNLYLSLLWRFDLSPLKLQGISLAAGVVIAELLCELGAHDLALKWPNDLTWQRRKLAGLLLETINETQGVTVLIIGLGLNLAMNQQQGDLINQPWINLTEVLDGKILNRNELAGKILDCLLALCADYNHQGFKPFLARWENFDALRGQMISVQIGARQFSGQYSGITEDGSLKLNTPAGIHYFQSGEIKVRLN